MTEKLVIIGSGMAAAKLLEVLADKQLASQERYAITVIGAEPQPSYNRILLSSILCGDKTPEDLPLLDRHWYQRHGVTLVTGEMVDKLDTATRQIFTATGRVLEYDKLVFATGARAHIPAIEGAMAQGVLGFRTLGDLESIRRYTSAGKKAVVIGGGLLGLEAAHGLHALGAEVSVVHRQPFLMNRQLDEEAGLLLQALLEARHIRFFMSRSPVAVLEKNGVATGVVLDDGESLDADLVLFAAGIDPNCELAAAAEIKTRRAIVVDSYLRTSHEHVFALGECCELNGKTFGLVAPVWQQAEILADILLGNRCDGFCPMDAPTQLKVSGVDLFSAGAMPFPPGSQSQILRDSRNGVYRRLVFSGNRLVGAILLGDRSGGSWYGDLISSGQDVSDMRPWIMFGQAYGKTG